MRLLLVLPLLLSCLLLQEPPEMPDPCLELSCAPYACDDGKCEDFCYGNSDCSGSYICKSGDCEPPCDDDDCPGGYTCNSLLNECNDSCLDDADCQDGWLCCNSDRRATCDGFYHCYRE